MLAGLNFYSVFDNPMGLSSASAYQQYGIVGQPAPEPNLTTWIDGN
jgi:hypothetical protein